MTTVVVREREALDPADADGRPGVGPEQDGPETEEDPFERDRQFFVQRFGHLGHVPPEVRETQMAQIRSLRARRDRLETGHRATAEDAPHDLQQS